MSRTILFDAATSLSSRTTTRRLNSKRISRAIENFQQTVEMLDFSGVTGPLEASKFIEICCSLPVSVSFTEVGGEPQQIKVHNYLSMTLGAMVSVTVTNLSTTEKCEINLIYS